jgi:hypothetical protein
MALTLVACEKADNRTPPPEPAAKPPPAPTAATPLRAKQIIDHRDAWLGRAVTVDILEPLRDSNWSSLPAKGEYDVEVTDVGAERLLLVPTAAHALGELHPPVRVHGTVQEHRLGTQIAVERSEPLQRETPLHLDRTEQLLEDRTKWSGKLVEVTGEWTVGFEVSRMGPAWIDGYPDATERCEPKHDEHADMMREADVYRVHVVGYAYTAGLYGHLSMSDAKIVATEIDFVDLCGKQ